MKIPFVFGKPASDENFTGRSAEIQQILQNCLSNINSIIISPGGWGKSSLLRKVALECMKSEQKIKFCFISLKNIREEEDFYYTVAKELLGMASPEIEIIEGLARKYLGKLFFKIKLISGKNTNFSLLLDRDEMIKFPEEIFNLAERIANENGLKIIVCIDEFQNISGFVDTLAFQQKLRSNWQNHQNVVYCIYGSDIKTLSNIFQTPEMPFFGFGEIIRMEKLTNEEWISFLTGRFLNTGKSIDKNSAELIVRLAENHPHYVQVLGQQAWLRSPYICNEQIIEEALENIILQNSLLYHNITGKLSNTQLSFINALICGTEKFNSQKVLLKFKLGTSGNITKIKKALIDKAILDIQSEKISFLDPFYKIWLTKYYFPDRIN